MKYIELFAGIGGFRYGLEQVNNSSQSTETKCNKTEHIKKQERRGVRTLDEERRESLLLRRKQPTSDRIFQCVYANEWDYDPYKKEKQYAWKIYQKQFGKGELDTRNIKDVPTESIPDHDLLTAGFPCQSFSIAGKRKGMSREDTRGNLINEVYRIAKYRRPKLLLLENVPGLFSSRGGKDFHTILKSLDEIGYDVEWDCNNTSVFLPQNRLRVFIVGHLRGTGGQKVFPIGEGNGEIKTMVNGKESGWREPKVFITNASEREFKWQGKNSPAVCARDYKDPKIVMNTLTEALGTRQGSSKEYINSVMNINSAIGQVRRLTPTECERLQGFPDGWTEGVSDSQRYKCLGNAVTTTVIQAIGEKIINEY